MKELVTLFKMFCGQKIFQNFTHRVERDDVRRRKMFEILFQKLERILIELFVFVQFRVFEKFRRTFEEPEIGVGQVEVAVKRG